MASTSSLGSFVREWVAPILAATLTALTLYGWAFEAQFDKNVQRVKPEMRREIEQMLVQQKLEIERDRLNMIGEMNDRLARIETMLENMKETR